MDLALGFDAVRFAPDAHGSHSDSEIHSTRWLRAAPRAASPSARDQPEELGALIGLSNRMIAYYERDEAEPPGAQLAPLATALRVSTDELLGLAPIT